MTKACKLVNNGFRDGIKRSDIDVGSVVLVDWSDVGPEWVLIVSSEDQNRPKNYKGYMNYTGVSLNADSSFQSDQILKVHPINVLEQMAKLPK